MNAQLNYIAAQQRTAEYRRAAARSRAATQVQETPLRVRPGPIARLGARFAHSRARAEPGPGVQDAPGEALQTTDAGL